MPELTGKHVVHQKVRIRETVNGSWMADLNQGGRRQRKTFPRLKDAKEWIDGRRAVRKKGGSLVSELKVRDETAAADALKLLREFDPSAKLVEVVQAYIARESAGSNTWTVAELIDHNVEDMRRKNRRKRSITDKLNRLSGFRDLFGGKRITDIRPTDVADWLDTTKAKGRNRQNYETTIQSLFNHAEKAAPGEFKNTVAKFPHQKQKERPPAEIVAPAVARDVLHHLESTGRTREALTLALCLFAGLRTSEVVGPPKDAEGKSLPGLRWNHIEFEEGEIHLPAHLSKTRDRREIKIPPNLMRWLVRYRQESGRIGPGESRYKERMKTAVDATGHAWPSNAARHSAGTYRAKIDGERAAAEMLGHTGSVRMFRDHYSAPTTKATARKFFEIMPADEQATGKVLDLVEASA